MRRYRLSEIVNCRDIGGYGVAGGEIRSGTFIRSAAPTALSAEDQALMRAVQLTDVIDLRGKEERGRDPNAFLQMEGVTVHAIPFLEKPEQMPTSDAEVPVSYMQIAKDRNMAKVMRVFCAAKGATLFHCTAGKDRTGTTAALLMLLAGAEDEDIEADYILSQPYMRKQLELFSKNFPQFPLCLVYPRAENIIDFLNLFHKEYATTEDYFLELGLLSGEIAALKRKLIF